MHTCPIFCFFAVLPPAFALTVLVERYTLSSRFQQGTGDPYNFSLINRAGDGRIRYAATLNIDSKPFTVRSFTLRLECYPLLVSFLRFS